MITVSRILLLVLLLTAVGCSGSEQARKKATYHHQLGVSNLNEGNYSSALEQLLKAEQLQPTNSEIVYDLATVYSRKKKYALAEQRYLQALQLRPGFALARYSLGLTYMEMKRWDDAIDQLAIASEDLVFSEQEMAGINLGLAYLGKGNTPMALSILRRHVVDNQQNPMAHLALGRVYYAESKFNLAINEYDAALRIAPDFSQAHYYLGLAYEAVKKNEAARNAFQQVIRLTPYTEIGQLAKERLDALK